VSKDWTRFAFDAWLFPEMAATKPLKDRTQAAVIVGHFCEQYLMHLMGGIKDVSLGQFGVEPDVTFWNNGVVDYDILVESKGMSRRHGTYVTHDQVFRYVTMTDLDFPLTRPRVFYAMCLHNVIDMAKRFNTEIGLIEALCTNYIGTLLIPLEIMHALISWMTRRANKGWNTPCHDHDWMTAISGPQLHKIIDGRMPLADWLTEKKAEQVEADRALPFPDLSQYDFIHWRTPQVRMHSFLVDSAWMYAMLPASDKTPRSNELVDEYRVKCLYCERTQRVYKYKDEEAPGRVTLDCIKCGHETPHEEVKDG